MRRLVMACIVVLHVVGLVCVSSFGLYSKNRSALMSVYALQTDLPNVADCRRCSCTALLQYTALFSMPLALLQSVNTRPSNLLNS